MRHILLASGLLTWALAGCGSSVAGTGGGGHGGAGTATSTGTTGTSTSTGMSTTTGTSTSSSVTSTSSSGGTCDPTTCTMPGFGCCNGACVNLHNDILNCGTCNHPCSGDHPYCDDGTCGTPPCGGVPCPSADFCCGTACCSAGQLCCDVPGPVETGPKCQAPDPMTGSCDPGCSACKCASPDTPVATPLGDRPIAEIAAGDLVYSVDHDAVVAVPVARVNRTPVHGHHVVRVVLATGAVLEVSPGHPTADGRTFGDLRAGDALDRIPVVSVELVPYTHAFTYDILPASETHAYFAGGALIGTTLGR